MCTDGLQCGTGRRIACQSPSTDRRAGPGSRTDGRPADRASAPPAPGAPDWRSPSSCRYGRWQATPERRSATGSSRTSVRQRRHHRRHPSLPICSQVNWQTIPCGISTLKAASPGGVPCKLSRTILTFSSSDQRQARCQDSHNRSFATRMSHPIHAGARLEPSHLNTSLKTHSDF